MSRLSVVVWLYRTALRVRRGPAIGYLVLAVVDVLAAGAFGLALRALIQGALRGDLAVALAASAAAALCWAVSTTGASARSNLSFLLTEATGVELSARILELVSRLDGVEHLERPEYVDRVELVRGGGDLLARTVWVLVDVAATVLRLMIVLAVLATVSPALAGLALLLVVTLWLQRRGQDHVRRGMLATAEDTRLAEHLHGLLTEPVPGMEIRVAGAETALRERASGVWARLIRRQTRAHWAAARLGMAGWFVFALGYTAALFFIVRSVVSGRSQPGDVVLMITLTTILRTQAEGTVWLLRQLIDGMHLVDSYLWLRGRGGGGAAPARAVVPERLRDGIVLHGLSFTYPGTDSPVLNDIDLRFPAGSTIAVVGEHGAGKTSLVKLLCRLYEPTDGRITVDGVPLADLPVPDWRARTTAGFQDFARFAFLARESVGIGDLSALADRDRVEQAVADGDAQRIIRELPSGMDTQLGALFDGVELSGGQWQRIALSRACMRLTPLLCVLDEPTASLDARSEYAVYQRQIRLARGLADLCGTVTVVISHRFSTVRMADLIVVLADGAVAEQGTHDELMARDGRYARLYRLQAAAYRADENPVSSEPTDELTKGRS
jgi:ATP-binding cassette subfamily B protein